MDGRAKPCHDERVAINETWYQLARYRVAGVPSKASVIAMTLTVGRRGQAFHWSGVPQLLAPEAFAW